MAFEVLVSDWKVLNNAVGAVYYHVNLCSRGGLAATPRIVRGEDGVQSQGLYDFPNMIHT